LAIPAVLGWYITEFDTIREHVPSWTSKAFGGVFVCLGVLALIANALVHRKLERLSQVRSATDTALPQIKEIVNQVFQSTEVPLDGYIYIGCTFTDVTFAYNNGPTGGFDSTCLVGGKVNFVSREPRIQQLLGFLVGLRLLRSDLQQKYTPILGDIPDPRIGFEIKTPQELNSHWNRIVGTWGQCGQRFKDFGDSSENLDKFWSGLGKQDPGDVSLPGDAGELVTAEDIDRLADQAISKAQLLRDSLMTIVNLISFRVTVS